MRGTKKHQFNFKCDEVLHTNLLGLARESDRTAPDFIRLCVEACVRMALEGSQHWVLPPVIYDVIERRKRHPILLIERETVPYELPLGPDGMPTLLPQETEKTLADRYAELLDAEGERVAETPPKKPKRKI